MANNKLAINTGVGKAYYSIIDPQSGAYGVPKELNDIVSFSVSPSESTTPFYAGDKKLIVDSTVSVTGSIVVPSVTQEALIDLFGFAENANGELLYNAKATRPNVVLIIEQNNYGGVQDFIYLWDTKLTLPSNEGSTKNDSITYGTKELAFECLVPDDGIYMTVKSSDQDGFVAPDFSVAPVKTIA